MVDDFDAPLRPLDGEFLAGMLDAQRRTGQMPPSPSTLPMADFAAGGVARFRCPLDCGWQHDENPGLEPMRPLRLPVDFTGDDLSAAISAQAAARAAAFSRRVESAIAAHFSDAHPDR